MKKRAETLVLHQAVVEVRYDRGVVYLDRCGSLTLRLEREVGKPFVSSLPNMEFGELSNAAERLVVRYGTKSFSVTQNWVRSPVRVEQLAPGAWEEVADTLDVKQAVTRLGVRFGVVWRVASVEEGEALLAQSGLCKESPEWDAIFGPPTIRSWTFTSNVDGGDVRAGLATISTNVQGGFLPPDVGELVPPFAVLLDLDHVYPHGSTEHFSLSRATLKEFVRTSWQKTKEAATKVEKLLGFGRPDVD